MTYKQFDVVVVPFPFTDNKITKKRPALVISDYTFNKVINKSIMTMITTIGHNPWPLDIPITDLKSAGLKIPSLIRMKFFTLDDQLVIKKIGCLSDKDKKAVHSVLKQLFNLK